MSDATPPDWAEITLRLVLPAADRALEETLAEEVVEELVLRQPNDHKAEVFIFETSRHVFAGSGETRGRLLVRA